MKPSTYRLVYAGLALALVCVVALGWALAPSGTATPLPAPIESVFPRPDDSIIRQTSVEVDMAAAYRMVLFVDGVRIPEQEMTILSGPGRYSWRPAPGRIIDAWTTGLHELRVVWERTAGPLDAGEFSWSFRVQ